MLNEASVLSTDYIVYLYDKVTDTLRIGSDSAVPVCRKNFLKYWWDSSMDDIKEKSIAALHKIALPTSQAVFLSLIHI